MFDHTNADFQLSSKKHESMMGEKFEPVLRTEIREAKALGLYRLRKNAPRERKETARDLISCVCVTFG